ncbi:tetratricopeptide repeat protein [Microcoleus sp. Pol7_A1]|uniref:tetratricopeptide repeat protein n=1 Tax=Microcoleus sp. Pol7_A1 TaxID=2818893 RepID=UPI002FD639EE
MKLRSIIQKSLFAIAGLGTLAAVIIAVMLVLNPDRFYALKGLVLMLLKQNHEARQACDKAIEIKQDSGPGWSCQVWLPLVLGQYNDVVINSEQIIKLFPDDPNLWEFWKWRGFALMELKRYDEALLSLNQSLQLKSDDADTQLFNCRTLYNLQQYDAALQSCNRSLEVKGLYSTLELKSLILLKLRRYEEALSSYNLVIQINPNDSEIWNNRGIALENLQRYKQAMRSFEQAIKIDPSNEVATYNRQRLNKQLN